MRRGITLLLLIVVAAGEALLGQSAPPTLSSADLSLDPPPGGGFFRYLPAGQWIDFDRPLTLTAAPGEDRSYSLELRGRDRALSAGDASGASEIRSYRIDKRPPPPPQAKPSGGLFRSSLSPSLSAEPGSLIYWALIGSDTSPEFRSIDQTGLPNLTPPAVGAMTYTLLAYAEDAAGNRSRVTRSVYRLAQSAYPTAAPAADPPEPEAVADDSLTPPAWSPAPGVVELAAPAAESAGADAVSRGILLLDVNPPSPPRALDDFQRLEAAAGAGKFRITCPYGWKGSLQVYYGYLLGEEVRFNPRPLTIPLAWEPEAAVAPLAPAPPELVVDPVGRGAFLSFPDYDGTIFVSVDGSPERAYAGPFLLEAAAGKVRVTWLGEDGHGRRSAGSETLLSLPPRAPELTLVGAEEGESIGHDLSLTQSAPGVLRYEIGSPGEPPSEPSGSSPMLKGPLPISCPAGQMREVLIRYRSFLDSGANSPGGEEKTLSFVLDKRPPAVPKLLSEKNPYSDKPLELSFAAEPPGVTIYASVTTDDGPESFVPVSAPLALTGAGSGPVDYLIKAYAVDSLGNRSADMEPVTVVVDRDSIYAAEGAAADGDGSPGHPFATLDAALRAIQSGHKKSINLRGTLKLSAPFVLAGELSLVGGYAANWSRDSSAKARIEVSRSGSEAALTLSGSILHLRGVELRSSGGAGPLLEAKDGAKLQIESSLLGLSGSGDGLLVRLAASTLDMEGSTVLADSGMSCSFVEARDSRLSLAGSIVKAQQEVRAFTAFSVSGGSLDISSSLFTSAAGLALRLFDLHGTKLTMLRSLVQVDGGSGYMRLGSFTEVGGEIRDCKFEVTWHGDATLFELAGQAPAFRYDSILAETNRGGIRYFDAAGSELEVWNSILSCNEGGLELLRSDRALKPGAFVADCIWGFSRLASGATEAATLGDFDAVNAALPRFGSTHHVAEPPRDTYSAPVKRLSPLNPASLCIGAALPIDEEPAVDFAGRPRPGLGAKVLPDIGADELSE